MTVRHMSGV